jgi:branched-chain amino acid transport system permease protein
MNWGLILTNALFTAIGINAIGYILATIGLNVHFGYTGLLNFGQAAFVAAGAYAVAIPVTEFGWSFWATIPLVVVVGALLALLLGIPTLRLRADYLAIVTIAAAEIVRIALNSVRFTWLTGGNDGLQGFTGDVSGLMETPDKRYEPFGFLGGDTQSISNYELLVIVAGWILIALASVVVWAVMRSPWGRVLRSIREDEDAARSLGKSVTFYKMQSLVLGGVIGALGGVVIAVGNRAAQPNLYSTAFTFFCWTMMILGGSGRIKGPIIGGIIFWFIIAFTEVFLSEVVKNDLAPKWLVNGNNFGLWRFMLTGLGLAALVVFRPQGIFGDKREQAFDVR